MSVYLLQVDTGEDYSVDDYPAAAGRLLNVFTDILSDQALLGELTYHAERQSAKSVLEAGLEPTPRGRALVGKAILEIDTSVKFNKTLWAKLIKERATQWPNCKVNKRQLPYEQSAQY